MPYKLEEIEGIGPTYAKKLSAADITDTDSLLNLCGTREGRKQVAAKTGISEQQLLKWSNMADLMRISGIGPQYAELLEAAGVDTVKELRNRNPENLAAQLREVNEKKKLARAVPAPSVVAEWVSLAKTTDPKISY